MKTIRILKAIAGRGDFVKGSQHNFALDVGMTVEVEESIASKWIASGIAEPLETKPAQKRPESEMLETPERAVLPRPPAKGRRK